MTTRTCARRTVLDADYLQNIDLLRANWKIIRDDALALQSAGAFEAAKAPGSAGYYDAGCQFFYKRGWIAKGTVVPSTAEDERRVFSALFSGLAPLRQKSRKLREERHRVHTALKFLPNATLLTVPVAILYAVFSII